MNWHEFTWIVEIIQERLDLEEKKYVWRNQTGISHSARLKICQAQQTD